MMMIMVLVAERWCKAVVVAEVVGLVVLRTVRVILVLFVKSTLWWKGSLGGSAPCPVGGSGNGGGADGSGDGSGSGTGGDVFFVVGWSWKG